MKHLILIVSLFITFIHIGYSQTDNDKAKAYYLEAVKAYESGNYSKAISNLIEVEKTLGSTNARVLHLKVKAYYAKGDYSNAKASLDQFSNYSDSAAENIKNEVYSYIVKVDTKLKEQRAAIKRQHEKDSIDDVIRRDKALKARQAAIKKAEIDFMNAIDEQLKYAYFSNENEYLWSISYNNKAGFIDQYGNVAIPLDFDYTTNFKQGLAWVKKNGKDGAIDKNGNIVIPFRDYKSVRSFSDNGWALVQLDNGKYQFIDKTGRTVLEPKYKRVWDFTDGLAVVSIPDLDYFGNPDPYSNIYGYIDTSGELAIPMIYSFALSFKDGYAAVTRKEDRKAGFINTAGEIVIPFEYNVTHSFHEGLAAVKLNKSYGFINKQGEVVIPFNFEEAEFFSEGLAAVKKPNGSWGYINKQGEVVIPYKYKYAPNFYRGTTWVTDYREWVGEIDKTGKLISPFRDPFAKN